MASSAEIEKAGEDAYRDDHMSKIFKEGFSFSGYERDALYLNAGSTASKRFVDISGVSGIDSQTDGRAAAFADFDNDGDVDVFLTTLQGPAHLLFRNNIGSRSSFVRVLLEGGGSGRNATGAVVRATTSIGTSAKVAGASGYLAQHDPRLLFGLGSDDAATIEVTWPSGNVDRAENIAAGSTVRFVEGAGLEPVAAARAFSLPDPFTQDATLLLELRVRPGDRFPDLPLEGGRFRDLVRPGRKALVNVWATWCVPCRAEMPELAKLAPELAERGVDIVGISVDVGKADAAAKAAESMGVGYPVGVATAEAVAAMYATEEVFVPLTFLVDESGTVADVLTGWSAATRGKVERFAAGQ